MFGTIPVHNQYWVLEIVVAWLHGVALVCVVVVWSSSSWSPSFVRSFVRSLVRPLSLVAGSAFAVSLVPSLTRFVLPTTCPSVCQAARRAWCCKPDGSVLPGLVLGGSFLVSALVCSVFALVGWFFGRWLVGRLLCCRCCRRRCRRWVVAVASLPTKAHALAGTPLPCQANCV